MRLPFLYQQWFRRKWPQHPTNQVPSNQLALQTLKSIQGTKDAGRDWFKLVDKFLQNPKIGMVPCTAFKGVYLWLHNNTTSYLCLTTDDMMLATSNHNNYIELCDSLEQFFDYTSSDTTTLSFINIRIIQSDLGISIDQTKHIEYSILRPYWHKEYGTDTIPY